MNSSSQQRTRETRDDDDVPEMPDPRELPREQSIGADVDEASFADWLVGTSTRRVSNDDGGVHQMCTNISASVDIEKRVVEVDAPMTKRERREARRTSRTSLDRVTHAQSFESSAASSRPLSLGISVEAVEASNLDRAYRDSIDSQKSRSMRSVKGSSGGFGWRMCFKRLSGTGESESERSRDDETTRRGSTMDEETPSPTPRSNADLILPVSLSTRASKTHPTRRVRHASLESIRGGPFRESEAAIDFPELRRLPIDDETFDTPTTPTPETRDRRSDGRRSETDILDGGD